MDPVQLVNDQIKAAMLSGNKLRLETLRALRAGIIEFEKSGTDAAMNEESFLKIVSSNVKKRKDSIEQFRAAGRTDLVDKEQSELDILMEFMPAQLSESEVADVVKRIAAEVAAAGTLEFKTLMPAVMKELKGKADGALIQAAVKQAVS